MKYPYKRIYVNGTSIDEHRYIMEQHLGRKLLPNEYVHHINGNKLDNRLENLIIMTPQQHNDLHITKLPKTKICRVCGNEFQPPIKHRGRNTICSQKCWTIYHDLIAKKNSKKVAQYNKNGELIKVWESINKIQKELGLPATNICKCCKGKIKSLGGFIWKYVEKEIIEHEN